MNDRTSWKCVSVDSENVALRIMKTHQAMDTLNCREGAIDCSVQFGFACALRGYVHERAEKRSRPPHFI
jgi:hypothetical protein